ncbi:hypothetical protein M388_02375 [Mesotoga sp. Brook.08.YT.4.2.5.4.]|nr:hypothetical protein M388_02375 [Mesotoga sp. Brook.08.YT.4.2.5.4.]
MIRRSAQPQPKGKQNVRSQRIAGRTDSCNPGG